MVGSGVCPQWSVREDQILPFVMQLLVEELVDVRRLMAEPPEELTNPNRQRREQHQRWQKQHDRLKQRMENAVNLGYETDDRVTRKEIDQDMKAMRAELNELKAKLATEPTEKGYTKEDREALDRYFDELRKRACMCQTRCLSTARNDRQRYRVRPRNLRVRAQYSQFV